MSKPLRIAIYDSGAGGLSIAKELKQRKHNCTLIYLADKALFPYGSQSDERLIHRATQLMQKLHNHYQPDAVIIACNTASTLLLPHLRERWHTPFIGVVPAIKPAAAASKNKSIAILATEATVQRDYVQQLIHDFAKGQHIKMHACPELVDMAEDYIQRGQFCQNRLGKRIEEICKEEPAPDHLVLACTHFPILKSEITSIANKHGATVIDSSKAIINRLEKILPGLALAPPPDQKIVLINTGNDKLQHYASYLNSDDNTCRYETDF
ncbi:glutamate racemase [Agaribacterium haliotis]|uniref:glutamate racemase n=1 Tax=Agaribacterium haliotis TaxID=2013869 RepID=UPI000BB53712|nr:glutamate racemase [Agaribacterium haliotis]